MDSSRLEWELDWLTLVAVPRGSKENLGAPDLQGKIQCPRGSTGLGVTEGKVKRNLNAHHGRFQTFTFQESKTVIVKNRNS